MDTSPAKYRALWKEIVDHLGLNSFHYLPYSLRRGGATSAYKEGMTFEQLFIKGRWQNVSTARLYLDQALQELTQIQLPPTAVARVRAAKLCGCRAGTRGGGGATKPGESFSFSHLKRLRLAVYRLLTGGTLARAQKCALKGQEGWT